MWLITNLRTGEVLLFSSVEAWQAHVAWADWTNYSLRFINKAG